MKPLSTNPGENVHTVADGSGEAGDRTLKLEEFLPYRLVMLAEQVSQSLSRLYAERYGLTNPEWRTMAALGQFGTMTSTDIGRNSRMHKTKVSRAVAELEKKGLIVRQTSDSDMRVSYLTLTDKGRATYRKLVPLALRFGDQLAGGLSADETAVLERVLTTLMERSDEIAREIGGTIGSDSA
ncbi:MarR family winged helix-turn-helix transcriptional regulator [Microbaculum marinisediminis]|uniref:MarR family transcriptional regulator n=1 Tax=Microbaculum marinisediminis TaxID=2931392 RepID=A0AAW5QVS7_9HYPH|nr:MarR family transcriptional regulator [Microbaculum sp. A6E488]MCT8971024.1 MarR family transcriptional regulator [Microbaculum sp. A6E488]